MNEMASRDVRKRKTAKQYPHNTVASITTPARRRRRDARPAHEPRLCTSHFVEPNVDFCPASANMYVLSVEIRIFCSFTSWT